MTWRENLRRASFRGVTFHTDESTQIGGRRNVHHEYPKRDAPAVEDFGRRQTAWRVRAYIVGPDYMGQRDALAAALDAAGPGRYVDHWRGEVQAVVDEYRMTESSRDGGLVSFDIRFKAAGGGLAPQALLASAVSLVAPGAAGVVVAAVAAFKGVYRA